MWIKCGFEPFRPQKEGFGGRSTDLNTSETNGLGSRDVITGGLQKAYIPASIHNEAMLSGAWTSIAQ